MIWVRVERSSILWPYRLAIAGVVVALAFLTFLFLRGPGGFQRLYYPLPVEYREAITDSAERHQVNPYLVAAVIDAESGWDAGSVSSAGAIGLMQMLPETAQELEQEGYVDISDVLSFEQGLSSKGPGPLYDPAVNIEFGTAYLRFLIERYHEVEPALAAYNAGMGNVDQWVGRSDDIRDSIEFPETRHYVLRVARAQDKYEELYPGAF